MLSSIIKSKPLKLSSTMSELSMTESDDEKTRNLQDKVYWLEMRVKLLQERNRELRKWITKLTNKTHEARKAGKCK